MNKPLVSVIMSAYNAEKFIEKSIKSVLDQTYSNIEFIICDDGSTDKTGEVIKRYPAIRYIYQTNKGQGAGRNNAASHAKGEYLAFIDADDCWVPDKLSVQIALFDRNPAVGAVYSDMEIVDSNGVTLGFNAKGKMKRGHVFNDLIAGNYMCGLSSLVVRTEILREVGGFSDHRYCQDFVFLLKVANKYEVDFSERTLVYYLSHEESITRKIDISYPEQISFYKEIPVLYQLNFAQQQAVTKQLMFLYFSYAILHFRKQNFSKTSVILKEARTIQLSSFKSKILSLLNWPVIRNIAYKWI